MRIAIIGAGFCGLAVAWYLINYRSKILNLEVSLVDAKGIGQGTSGIAAGLLHCYAGAHAKLNWRGKEGFQTTQELLTIASEALNYSVVAKNPGILRLALNEEQAQDFQRCAKNYPLDTQWLDSAACQTLAPGCIQAPGLWIKTGLTVYSSLYLKGLWQACLIKGVKFEKRRIFSLKEVQNVDFIILATGAETLELPELTSLPLTQVKGQLLEFSWPRNWLPLLYALNSHVYLLMNEKRTTCLVGATYEKKYSHPTIDIEVAKREILSKAYSLFPPLKEASLLNCYAGLRSVGPHNRPLMQRLCDSQWVLAGMGSKGLLYHALFAKELVENILHNHL